MRTVGAPPLPPCARLTRERALSFVSCQVANVFVLPGVPEFFASKVASILEHFVTGGTPLFKRTISLSAPEVNKR